MSSLYPVLTAKAAGFIAYTVPDLVIRGVGPTRDAATANALPLLSAASDASNPETGDRLSVVPATAELLSQVEGGKTDKWERGKDSEGNLLACSPDERSEAVEFDSEREDEQSDWAVRHKRRAALTEAGTALFGAEWVSPVARGLGVAVRTVQRWMSADGAVPEWATAALPTLAVEAVRGGHVAELERRAEAIRRLAAQAKPRFPKA